MGGPQTLLVISLIVLLVVVSVPDTVLVSTPLIMLLVLVTVPDMAPVSKVVSPKVLVSKVVAEGVMPPGKEGEVEGITERLGGG